MNSAIRIAGLRGDTSADQKIIDIAMHENITEDNKRAAYEALGYLVTKKAVDFLNRELDHQDNTFFKSEII